MSRDDATVRLLELAVPPIPPPLQTPPYERIRWRVRRRRIVVAGCSFLAVGALISAGSLVAIHQRPSTVVILPPGSSLEPTASSAPATPAPSSPGLLDPTPPRTTPSALPGAPRDAVTWRVVRVDSAGTGLTVFVNAPIDGCFTYPTPHATTDNGDPTVTITVTAQAAPAECSRVIATPLHITLSKPLGNRQVRDGRSGALGTAFQDRELPMIPPPWTEVHMDYFPGLDGEWSADYTRPGGPDLMFTVRVGTITLAGQQIRLGSRTGYMGGDAYGLGVQWQVGGLAYRMLLEPSEGKTGSMDDLLSVVNELTWP